MTSVPDIQEKDLGITDSLGGGADGEVYRVASDKTSVYKRFHPHVLKEVNEIGLVDTIACLSEFDPSVRSYVISQTAWPHTLVRRGRQVVGFLMPLVGKQYFSRLGRKDDTSTSPNDWNRLAFIKKTQENPNLVSDLPEMHLDEYRLDRLNLCRELSAVFAVLHEKDVIVGDVSGRNILWAPPTVNRVLLIDCDGMRKSGKATVTKGKQSPDWFDPFLTGETTIQSDLYKLSLAIYRGYFTASNAHPPTATPTTIDQVDRQLLEFCRKGVAEKDRPTASDWVTETTALIKQVEDIIRFDGRPPIDWRNETSPATSVVPTAPTKKRPEMDWRQ